MDEINKIEKERSDIIRLFQEYKAMRKGSVTWQYMKRKKRGRLKQEKIGPYPVYTKKVKGKTVSRRLTEQEAERYRQEVENYHTFCQQCDDFACLTERLGDLMIGAPDNGQKKKRRKLR